MLELKCLWFVLYFEQNFIVFLRKKTLLLLQFYSCLFRCCHLRCYCPRSILSHRCYILLIIGLCSFLFNSNIWKLTKVVKHNIKVCMKKRDDITCLGTIIKSYCLSLGTNWIFFMYAFIWIFFRQNRFEGQVSSAKGQLLQLWQQSEWRAIFKTNTLFF